MLPAVGTVARHVRESAAAFKGVFANPGLRRLQLAWAVAIVGHWAYLVAVAVFAYDVGGAGAVGAPLDETRLGQAVDRRIEAAVTDRPRVAGQL